MAAAVEIALDAALGVFEEVFVDRSFAAYGDQLFLA
jgi:hypothetical protein